MTIEMPATMRDLPICPVRKLPVPWFVSWIDGKPEFRVADGGKLHQAVTKKLCWVCGKPHRTSFVFVIGPMCTVNRITSEPPTHPDCADYSAKACPFLSRPGMVRREENMPEGTCDAPGMMLKGNPGVSALWLCDKYAIRQPPGGGILFEIPTPFRVKWWTQGRPATRSEVLAAFDTGYPALESVAREESASSLGALERAKRLALKFIPD